MTRFIDLPVIRLGTRQVASGHLLPDREVGQSCLAVRFQLYLQLLPVKIRRASAGWIRAVALMERGEK